MLLSEKDIVGTATETRKGLRKMFIIYRHSASNIFKMMNV